jgi:hypothetical protein
MMEFAEITRENVLSMPESPRPPQIAFSETARHLARQIRAAELDHAAFRTPLKVCELPRCRATCCHDGVILEADEIGEIQQALDAEREWLDAEGWEHRDWFERYEDRFKSITLSAGPEALAEDFPAHFPRTRCIFLDAEHRCVLQRISMKRGMHPWHWKPVSCWMHPLILRPAGGGRARPQLTLARPENDPVKKPGYPGFSAYTPCGIEQADGPPAHESLRTELELLGEISGRDVCREIEQG